MEIWAWAAVGGVQGEQLILGYFKIFFSLCLKRRSSGTGWLWWWTAFPKDPGWMWPSCWCFHDILLTFPTLPTRVKPQAPSCWISLPEQGCRDGSDSHLEALALRMCSHSHSIPGCRSRSIGRSGAGTAQVPSPGSAGCSRDLVLPPAKSLWLDAGSRYRQAISFPPLSTELVHYLLSYPGAGLGAEHPSPVLAASAGEKTEFAKPPDLILWERTAS